MSSIESNNILETIQETIQETRNDTITPGTLKEPTSTQTESVLTPESKESKESTESITLKEETLKEETLKEETLKEKTLIETKVISDLAMFLQNKLDLLVIYIGSITVKERVDSSNIIMLIHKVMVMVEQFKDLTGKQKQDLVISAITKIVLDSYSDIDPEDKVERELLLMIIKKTLPSIINTFVSAINGDIKFYKSAKCGSFFNIFNMFNCCKKK
jgi:hypothetical protein